MLIKLPNVFLPEEKRAKVCNKIHISNTLRHIIYTHMREPQTGRKWCLEKYFQKNVKFLQKDLEVKKMFVPLQSQNKAVVVKW